MDVLRIPSRMNNTLKLAGKFIITFLIAFFWLQTIASQNTKIQFRHKLERLNIIILEMRFKPLPDTLGGGQALDKGRLEKYIHFYKTTARYFPQAADSWGMLGYCYYLGGKKDLAKESFEKAFALKPKHFWFSYNLGVLYFQEKQYSKAGEYLQQATAASFEDALEFIQSSKIVYRLILMEDPFFGAKTKERFMKGYSDSYKMLVLSSFYEGDFSSLLKYSKEALELNLGEEKFFSSFVEIASRQGEKKSKAPPMPNVLEQVFKPQIF